MTPDEEAKADRQGSSLCVPGDVFAPMRPQNPFPADGRFGHMDEENREKKTNICKRERKIGQVAKCAQIKHKCAGKTAEATGIPRKNT